jgi:hypothetical protein
MNYNHDSRTPARFQRHAGSRPVMIQSNSMNDYCPGGKGNCSSNSVVANVEVKSSRLPEKVKKSSLLWQLFEHGQTTCALCGKTIVDIQEQESSMDQSTKA